MNFFGLIPHNFLGIDIGTSAIRLVEVSSWAGRKKLESYGEIPAAVLYKEPFRTFEKNTLLLSDKDIARAIRAVMEEANIKAKKVAFSIPDFSTFFTNFELPPMTDREIPQAIRAEARRHIPLPLAEVTLDWQVIPQPVVTDRSQNIRVLLVAVPNETINQYKKIADDLDLDMIALEAEVFGMTRSLISKEERGAIALVDIGGRSTSCSIIYRGILRLSHSFDISGGNFVERLSKSLGIDYREAEGLMKKYGVLGKGINTTEAENVKQALESQISLMVGEIEDSLKTFKGKESEDVEKIILAGGTALLPGLIQYFQNHFSNKKIELADPFGDLYYPPILDRKLRIMGPSYAIATGMALKGLE